MLAGVNGAGKSSIGGHLLQQAGLAWYNPDQFARELVQAIGSHQTAANAAAWQEGVRRLDHALAEGRSFAFETTLGGNTIARRLRQATASHDVIVWFCGLASPEQHIARVRARVQMGGHDIPVTKIRERWISAQANLIGLMPHLAQVQIYDNSREALPGQPVPDPQLVLTMAHGHLHYPTTADALRQTPDWAKPLVEAALHL